MFSVLLILTIIITPTQSDLDYMAGILCGETCGMPVDCMEFVGQQLRYDWYKLGTHGLRKRWYAPLKESKQAREIMEQVFAEPFNVPQCRLIGSKSDSIYWRKNGYLAVNAVPDYQWVAHGMEVSAYGCAWRPVVINRATECSSSARCPR